MGARRAVIIPPRKEEHLRWGFGGLPQVLGMMTTLGEGGNGMPVGRDLDEDQRRVAFAGLANLDVLTADDEEEIGRFRAFVAEPSARHRLMPWSRRRPALPI